MSRPNVVDLASRLISPASITPATGSVFDEMEAMLLVMLIYLSVSLSMAAVMNAYNRRSRLIER